MRRPCGIAPVFRGLTWDHPRGYDALAQAAQLVNADRERPLIGWDKQPLEGFESAPIAQLAADHDLLVLDHPHIGEAVASNCLHPLEDLFSAEQIKRWQVQSVGPAMASYQWGGKNWALPLDVATQVMVRRADVISRQPADWDEVLDVARRLPVAQSLAGPHAFLTLISMVAGLGARVGGERLVPDGPACSSLAAMHTLYALRPQHSETLNPIALSEAMAGSSSIALIPLVFGYVTYSKHGTGQLAFSDTIGVGAPGTGGVLGGTGIAFCQHAEPSQDLLDHIDWLMNAETQRTLIPAFGGQPSARSAWTDAEVNNTWGNFYSDCLKTAENALLRPRFDGYIAFQISASEVIQQALDAREDEHMTLKRLRALWQQARAKARGPLEGN